MNARETKLHGCYELQPVQRTDHRGLFVKVFEKEAFAQLGLATRFTEQYYSISHPGVLRGLHFQVPPYQHAKLVYCIEGGILDAVVDLRVHSPTYGEYVLIGLSADRGNMLYVPPGLAHGFYVPRERSIVVYNVTCSYSAEHDRGIRWDSAGITWQVSNPVISDRDRNFPPLFQFQSPFRMEGTES